MNSGINGLLEKIAAIASREISTIEKDLLLQYTRELYEHILQLNAASGIQSEIEETSSETIDETVTETPLPASERDPELADSDPEIVQKTPIAPEPAPHEAYSEPEPPLESGPETESVKEEQKETELITPPEMEPMNPVSIPADAVVAESVSEEVTSAEVEQESITMTISEQPFTEPEDFELEPELKNEKVFSPKNLVEFRLWNRDIRTYIGINDKYNFISELFNDNAEAYEEILNEINGMESAEEARYFLENSGVTTLYKWKDDGFSEQIFYNVLSQFFAAR